MAVHRSDRSPVMKTCDEQNRTESSRLWGFYLCQGSASELTGWANGRDLVFSGDRRTPEGPILDGLGEKHDPQKPHFPLTNTLPALASIRDQVATDSTCRDLRQDGSILFGGPVADGRNKTRASTPI